MQSTKEKEQKFDRLVFFQSEPLVFLDPTSRSAIPLPQLDFKDEQKEMNKKLKGAEELGAKIELVIKPATKDELSAFFAQRASQVLHFSGHGHKELLFLENRQGEFEKLECNTLKQWVATGGGFLKLAVVVARHSGVIGRAFLDAGVPHVICCELDKQLDDEAARIFASDLYLNLACGRTLQESFKKASIVSGSRAEADKLQLLSRPDADANQPVFFTQPMSPLEPKEIMKTNEFPSEPTWFIWRQKEMHSIIKCLNEVDLVRVNGVPGVGKTSVVAATCRHMRSRWLSFGMDFLFWLDASRQPNREGSDDLLSKLEEAYFDYVLDEDKDMIKDDNYKSMMCDLQNLLRGKKLYLVIDEGNDVSRPQKEKLEQFMADLLQLDSEVKIIVISSEPHKKHESKEKSVVVEPLDFENTMRLHWRHMDESVKNEFQKRRGQHGPEFQHLPSRFVISNNDDFHHVWRVIGEGVPREIITAAEEITDENISLLMEWWWPLNFKNTVEHFWKHLPKPIQSYFGGRLKDFIDALDLDKNRNQNRYNELMRRLGSGIPREIEKVAKRMDEQQAQELVDWCLKEPSLF